MTRSRADLDNRLRLWRVDQGLTEQELADLGGLSVSMVSRVEHGERGLAPMTKARVARRLGVRIADLFDVEPVEDEVGEVRVNVRDLPPVLTIAEAARLARVSTRIYYAQAHEFLESGGERGLPVVALGRRPVLRVPKPALLAALGLDSRSESTSSDDGTDVVDLNRGRANDN